MEEKLINELIEKLKDKKEKYKKIFTITKIEKSEAVKFVGLYHYLGPVNFFSEFQYGLFYKNNMVGVAAYAQPQGAMAIKGWFPNNQIKDTHEVMELQRLAMLPQINGFNATSYLLSHSIKMIAKEGVRAIITLADSTRHVGSIYQVTNFKYYGLTSQKSDFYVESTGKKVGHGKTKGIKGVYIPRNRKYRYAYLIDKKLLIGYCQEKPPVKNDLVQNNKKDYYIDNRLGVKQAYKYDEKHDAITKVLI